MGVERSKGTVTKWIHGAKQGSQTDWHAIWERLYPQFVRLAGAVMRNDRLKYRMAPEDLVNDAFLRANKPSIIEALENSTHLHRQMALIMSRLLKDRGRRLRGEAKVARVHAQAEHVQVDHAESLALRDCMVRLELLNERQWSLFVRREIDGASLREIARVDGMAESTLRADYKKLMVRIRALDT